MRRLRHGFAQRIIVLLLAAAMPLCCCTLRGFAAQAGGGSQAMSCCTPKACCAASTANEQQSPEPCDACGTSCCIKVIGSLFDWTPPVDELGTIVVDLSCASECIPESRTTSARSAHPPGDPPGVHCDTAVVLRRTSHIQV